MIHEQKLPMNLYRCARSALVQIVTVSRILKSSRYPVPLSMLAGRLERSEKTVSRIIHCLRDDLGAPIEYDAHYRGYVLTDKAWRLDEVKNNNV